MKNQGGKRQGQKRPLEVIGVFDLPFMFLIHGQLLYFKTDGKRITA